jgi:hypothetical protein
VRAARVFPVQEAINAGNVALCNAENNRPPPGIVDAFAERGWPQLANC